MAPRPLGQVTSHQRGKCAAELLVRNARTLMIIANIRSKPNAGRRTKAAFVAPARKCAPWIIGQSVVVMAEPIQTHVLLREQV